MVELEGITYTTYPPTHIFRLQAIHQLFQCYTPPPQFFKRGRKQNIRFPVQICGPHQHISTFSYGPRPPPEASLVAVDPTNHTHFHNIFHNVAENIASRLSSSQSDAVNGHWSKWEIFCRYMALDPYLSCIDIQWA